MPKLTLKTVGTALFYIGGAVWIVFAISKYVLGLNVAIRQFLPYHLAAVIPGIILKHGITLYERLYKTK